MRWSSFLFAPSILSLMYDSDCVQATDREVSNGLERFRNKLLLHMPLGAPKPAVDPLPSDRDSKFAYGDASGTGQNIRDLVGHAYTLDWVSEKERREQQSVRVHFH